MEVMPRTFIYNTNAVSEVQFNQHMILYRGYVTKINEITQDLKSDAYTEDTTIYSGLKSGETYSINGIILHEEYFGNMTMNPSRLGAKAVRVFNETFGGYEKFISEFTKCASVARGWCLLVYEQRTKCFKITVQDTHDSGVITMAFPILVLDMYEHAYFYDYQTDKQKYIKAFTASIDWDVVEKRLCKIM